MTEAHETRIESNVSGGQIGTLAIVGEAGAVQASGSVTINIGGRVEPRVEREHLAFEPAMVLVEAGSFWMGSDPGVGVNDDDTPRCQIDLPAYRIGRYP